MDTELCGIVETFNNLKKLLISFELGYHEKFYEKIYECLPIKIEDIELIFVDSSDIGKEHIVSCNKEIS